MGRTGEIGRIDRTSGGCSTGNPHSGMQIMGRWQGAGLGSRSLAVGCGVVCLLGWGLAAGRSPVAAQEPPEFGAGPYPAAYAIRGAKVVAAVGKVFDPGTIVVRRGVIEAVGPAKEVAMPYDAESIEGKGLVVYPGFIDVYTTVGQRSGVERSATGRGRLVDV